MNIKLIFFFIVLNLLIQIINADFKDCTGISCDDGSDCTIDSCEVGYGCRYQTENCSGNTDLSTCHTGKCINNTCVPYKSCDEYSSCDDGKCLPLIIPVGGSVGSTPDNCETIINQQQCVDYYPKCKWLTFVGCCGGQYSVCINDPTDVCYTNQITCATEEKTGEIVEIWSICKPQSGFLEYVEPPSTCAEIDCDGSSCDYHQTTKCLGTSCCQKTPYCKGQSVLTTTTTTTSATGTSTTGTSTTGTSTTGTSTTGTSTTGTSTTGTSTTGTSTTGVPGKSTTGTSTTGTSTTGTSTTATSTTATSTTGVPGKSTTGTSTTGTTGKSTSTTVTTSTTSTTAGHNSQTITTSTTLTNAGTGHNFPTVSISTTTTATTTATTMTTATTTGAATTSTSTATAVGTTTTTSTTNVTSTTASIADTSGTSPPISSTTSQTPYTTSPFTLSSSSFEYPLPHYSGDSSYYPPPDHHSVCYNYRCPYGSICVEHPSRENGFLIKPKCLKYKPKCLSCEDLNCEGSSQQCKYIQDPFCKKDDIENNQDCCCYLPTCY
ncbi:hypothetical protein DICPUDRAFT_79155 [Dictyostelium purpureum]|uniref:DSCP-N domain-containing protein n=1 Tax=Dictyostelium purpureum TaxID=5786 RepID=F0ZLQ9_DICPU|nr:uncharacterized protein DICPUDRAFT_79155 [Dictyostelium purpureum]EGC35101.1 hypothetical protein DICPUDRAFT_79155 [Dictyostelium purpureum]|eukprot:XP_003288353.1 hypothetical protein DICPUDRAFT_79155 [Dictyostelium purpureum]